MSIQFRHPFTAIVAGPTSCGKTYFINKVLQHLNVMTDTKFERIIWYYDEWQPMYKENKESNSQMIDYKQGVPDIAEFTNDHPKLIIIDDLMRETGGSIVDIFTKGSHHRNLSVFYITQNIFHQGRGQRDISLNANYIIYFKNPRDRAQVMHLARQLYPELPKFICEAYKDATSRPHGYLFFDLKQDTSDEYRFLTNILPEEQPPFSYVPKKGYKTKKHR